MKTLLLAAALLLPLSVFAIRPVSVGKGSVTTSPGIGGYADIGFAFAKGDVISLNAHGEKKLQRVVALLYPDRELMKTTGTEDPKLQFTMPEDGIIVFRFISDRSGTNKVKYSVSRSPGSASLRHYDTRVVWLKPADGAPGNLVPVRANSHYDKSRVTELIH
jgi:hypothetical protein